MLTLLFCIMQFKLMPGVILGRTCHKYHFCRNKVLFVTTKQVFCHDQKKKLLSRQNYVCRVKHIFVTTKLLLQQIFVATNIILSQQKFCRIFCRDKTHLLLWQKYACHDKIMFVETNNYYCCDKSFVCAKIVLLCQKFCHNKDTFVMTKDMFCEDKNDTCGSSHQ